MISGGEVLIIGAGELGMALDFVLGKNLSTEPGIWDKEEQKVANWQPFEKVLAGRKIVFLAVPTRATEDVLTKIKMARAKDILPVILSKGLTETGETALEVAKKVWQKEVVIISGPMLAEELKDNKPTQAVISGDRESVGRVLALFNNTLISLEFCDDLVGISWCGPLKNLYAIGLGMIEGGQGGDNRKGAFVQEAVLEMMEAIEFFGGRRSTVYTLAGIADLVATGFSSGSANFQLGVKLTKGVQWISPTEGIMAALGIGKRVGASIASWPLMAEIVEKVIANKHSGGNYL